MEKSKTRLYGELRAAITALHPNYLEEVLAIVRRYPTVSSDVPLDRDVPLSSDKVLFPVDNVCEQCVEGPRRKVGE